MMLFVTPVLIILILCCGLLLGINAVFSPWWFNLFEANPIVLKFFDHQLTELQLRHIVINGWRFTPEEAAHFADVRHYLDIVRQAPFILLPLALALAWWDRAQAQRTIIITAALHVLLAAGLVAAYFMGAWKPLWGLFHELLFPEKSWQFGTSTLTLQLYGRQLMQTGVASVLALPFVFYITLWLFTRPGKVRHVA